MPSPFDRAAAKLSAAVDRRFAGSASDAPKMLLIVPMCSGKGYTAPAPDGSRQPIEVIGALIRRPERMHVVDNRLGKDFNRALVMRETYATIDTARLGSLAVRKGDQVVDLDSGETLEVTAVEPHAITRTRLTLVTQQ